MERESFENREIAELLNRGFVPDQGGPRGAARRRPHLHDLRPGDHRLGRLADVGVSDARAEAVLRRHVFPARKLAPGVGARCRGVAAGSRADRRIQPGGDGATHAGGRGGARRRRPGRFRAGGRFPGLPPRFRCPVRRLWRRAEVPASGGVPLPAALLGAHRERGGARNGAGDAECNGARRNPRPPRRRLSPLRDRCALARAALREDAVRPGAARGGVPGGVPGLRRGALRRRGARNPGLRFARHDGRRGRVLLRRGRRQRGARGGLLSVEPGGDRKRARRGRRSVLPALRGGETRQRAPRPRGRVRGAEHPVRGPGRGGSGRVETTASGSARAAEAAAAGRQDPDRLERAR